MLQISITWLCWYSCLWKHCSKMYHLSICISLWRKALAKWIHVNIYAIMKLLNTSHLSHTDVFARVTVLNTYLLQSLLWSWWKCRKQANALFLWRDARNRSHFYCDCRGPSESIDNPARPWHCQQVLPLPAWLAQKCLWKPSDIQKGTDLHWMHHWINTTDYQLTYTVFLSERVKLFFSV